MGGTYKSWDPPSLAFIRIIHGEPLCGRARTRPCRFCSDLGHVRGPRRGQEQRHRRTSQQRRRRRLGAVVVWQQPHPKRIRETRVCNTRSKAHIILSFSRMVVTATVAGGRYIDPRRARSSAGDESSTASAMGLAGAPPYPPLPGSASVPPGPLPSCTVSCPYCI